MQEVFTLETETVFPGCCFYQVLLGSRLSDAMNDVLLMSSFGVIVTTECK